MNKIHKIKLVILALLCLVLMYELFRDTFAKLGDFQGYVEAGNLVIEAQNIYTNPEINTWPPFFSIVSVPLALIDSLSRYLVRFIWLAGSLIAMFFIMSYTTKLSVGQGLAIFPLKTGHGTMHNSISILHRIVLIPLLISLRFIMDNMSNIQINIFMLLLAMAAIYNFAHDRNILAAIILAFSISLKVYTIFLFLYFVIKREYKIVAYTLLFLLIFCSIPFFVFGIEQTLDYYRFWYTENVIPFASIGHKNQSFFSMMRSLLMHESPALEGHLDQAIYVNIIDLSLQQTKFVAYIIVAAAGLFVCYLFRLKLTSKTSLQSFIEYAFILSIIPLLSPIAWKAYFIFLFPAYFVNYLFLFAISNSFNNKLLLFQRMLFFVSIALTVFSSELFVGGYFSDVLEVYSCITIGSILLASNLLIFYTNFMKCCGSLSFLKYTVT